MKDKNDLVWILLMLMTAIFFSLGSYSASFQTFNHLLFSVVFFVLGVGSLIAMGFYFWGD